MNLIDRLDNLPPKQQGYIFIAFLVLMNAICYGGAAVEVVGIFWIGMQTLATILAGAIWCMGFMYALYDGPSNKKWLDRLNNRATWICAGALFVITLSFLGVWWKWLAPAVGFLLWALLVYGATAGTREYLPDALKALREIRLYGEEKYLRSREESDQEFDYISQDEMEKILTKLASEAGISVEELEARLANDRVISEDGVNHLNFNEACAYVDDEGIAEDRKAHLAECPDYCQALVKILERKPETKPA